MFQSTLPVGGATLYQSSGRLVAQVSIHAPRGGSDTSNEKNPKSQKWFQSTLPVGGATR